VKKINLIFGTHNHQPIGNFDSVFEESYQKSYKPFLDVFEKFPNLKIAKHYTGILFDWLKAKHPDLLEHLGGFVKKGNVELISGGFYEPILAVIPDADKVGQIKKLTSFIKKNFDYNATGLWLAERIWEQHLTKPLAEAGIKYVILDDTHFKYAGLKDEELYGYYITEEQGKTVNLFPISKQLRYTIPFQDVEATIDYLRSIATEDGNRVVVFADDGEKFGVWPNTYDHCYGKDDWLRKFFQALTDNQDWIRTMTFEEAMREIKPVGRIYLPNASYAEMMHWSLPTTKAYTEYDDFEHKLKDLHLYEKYDPFVRGGFWRNFMVKYPESNNMHKKMLQVSERAQRLISKKKKVKPQTLDKIWAAQCNCPYWHGVFGGTYLPNLRHPIYTNLIEAEADLDKLDNAAKVVRASVADFDKDGQDEVFLESTELGLFVKPSKGGTLYELDYKKAGKNLLDIMTRREEGYHAKLRNMKNHQPKEGEVSSIHDLVIAKEEGLENYLTYDGYRRGSLIDHFVSPETTLQDFAAAKQTEISDFILGEYDAKLSGNTKEQHLTLSRMGNLLINGHAKQIRVTKTITLAKGERAFSVHYKLENLSDGSPLHFKFGIEMCYGLLAGDAPDRYYYGDGINPNDNRLRSTGESHATWIGLKDQWLKIDARLESSVPTDFYHYPIETISLSEAGFERVYQGSTVLATYNLTLEKTFEVTFRQTFNTVK
jgi:hypothetical protein